MEGRKTERSSMGKEDRKGGRKKQRKRGTKEKGICVGNKNQLNYNIR